MKAILGFAAAAVAGWLLQSWEYLQSSALGHLSTNTHLPVIEIAVWGVGVALVGTVLLDHWNFCIELRDDHLLISERLGTTRLYYDNIEEVAKVPLGAGISLKDRATWLDSFQGRKSGLEKLYKISALLKRAYGCDLCIKKVRLDIGVEPFVALLHERVMGVAQCEEGTPPVKR